MGRKAGIAASRGCKSDTCTVDGEGDNVEQTLAVTRYSRCRVQGLEMSTEEGHRG
jgi:hypothetical protein